ncbi:MAG: type I-C CRISPR-associated protein Cas7/Csd2 [Firmicutes bacterium HGW-Firmicutes-13]|nr:MAG: type I-C CRISPR-associated protein Cas7/Csd2 [Firmicutes bacterium HGW-Firmicutes-13]
MKSLSNKIDFALIVSVKNANPNGDPLDGNRPRTNYDGFGEMSDVCIKRKIRNRLQDMKKEIFVQSDENRVDEYRSLRARADSHKDLKALTKDKEKYATLACEKWIDVRSFGQVFAFTKNDGSDAVSIGIRGPVSIQTATSVSPVDISSMQITKSVNLETGKDPDKKAPDTMGMKHRVDFGVYTIFGSINTQLASKTGFSDEDAKLIKEALKTIFENDVSAARPDGSMEVVRLYWWKHNNPNGQYSSAVVHRLLSITPKEEVEKPRKVDDYIIQCNELKDLNVEVFGLN